MGVAGEGGGGKIKESPVAGRVNKVWREKGNNPRSEQRLLRGITLIFIDCVGGDSVSSEQDQMKAFMNRIPRKGKPISVTIGVVSTCCCHTIAPP